MFFVCSFVVCFDCCWSDIGYCLFVMLFVCSFLSEFVLPLRVSCFFFCLLLLFYCADCCLPLLDCLFGDFSGLRLVGFLTSCLVASCLLLLPFSRAVFVHGCTAMRRRCKFPLFTSFFHSQVAMRS